MNRIAIYLNKSIDGVVYSTPSILERYATDRSMLRITPRIVAVPNSTTDIRRLVRFSHQLAQKKVSLPITVRGSGYSKTGSDLGSGLIISTEKMTAIQEIDVRQRLVRVQSGVKLCELKKALSLCGLDLPVFGNQQETIGGLIAKSASASNNTKPSTISDFIQAVEVILADGSLLEVRNYGNYAFRNKKLKNDREGELYRAIDDLVEEGWNTISTLSNYRENRFGYSGISTVKTKRGFNLIPLICGSEGTLGIISEVILRVEPVFDTPNYVAIPCKTATDYNFVVHELKRLKFTDIIVYDSELYNAADKTGKTSRFFRKLSNDGYIVLANVKDDSQLERRNKLSKIRRALPDNIRIIKESDDNHRDFDELESALNAYLNDGTLNSYHLPLIDGVFIPSDKQESFLNDVTALSQSMNLPMAVYGSVDFNTFSIRPSLSPATVAGRKRIIQFLGAYLKIVSQNNGYPCGEAAEGRFMAIFARKFEDEQAISLYRKVKQTFDPNNILNPYTKHDTNMRTTLQHFRSDYNNGIIDKD